MALTGSRYTSAFGANVPSVSMLKGLEHAARTTRAAIRIVSNFFIYTSLQNVKIRTASMAAVLTAEGNELALLPGTISDYYTNS